jgi:hypothetical protein
MFHISVCACARARVWKYKNEWDFRHSHYMVRRLSLSALPWMSSKILLPNAEINISFQLSVYRDICLMMATYHSIQIHNITAFLIISGNILRNLIHTM